MRGDLTQGPILKTLLLFALPMIAGNLLQQCYNIADTLIVGRFLGTAPLAAVGSSFTVMTFLTSVLLGLCMGSGALFSIRFGQKDTRGLKEGILASFALLGAVTAALSLAVFLGLDWIIWALRTPEGLVSLMREYLLVIFAGLAGIFLYNFFASLLRSLGNSVTPLAFLAVSACLNIGLDLLFVMVFHWGIPGAAIATVIAQAFSFLFCFVVLRKIEVLKISRQDMKLEKGVVLRLLTLGMPLMFQNVIISVGGMVVQTVINGFGFIFVAGFTAANKLYGLLEMAAISFGYAITTYTGQNLGAGRLDRIRTGMRSGMAMAALTSVAVSAVMLIFGRSILSLFVSGDPAQTAEVLSIAYRYLSVMSYFLVVLYALCVYRSALQGLGDTVLPMVSGIVEFVMRVCAVMLLPAVIGQNGVFYAEILAWIGAAVLLVTSYYRKMHQLTHGKQIKRKTADDRSH